MKYATRITLWLLIPVLFLGCASVDLSQITTYGKPILSGRVIKKTFLSGKGSENDIVWDGIRESNSIGSIDIAGNEIEPAYWSGSVKSPINNRKLEITYITTQERNENSPNQLNRITVTGLPDYFSFPMLHIRDSTIVYPKMLPYKLTSVSVKGTKLDVLLTRIQNFGLEGVGTNLMHLVYDYKQVFRIIDDRGGILAEFTKDSYHIYAESEMCKVEDICTLIGVFAVIRASCKDAF